MTREEAKDKISIKAKETYPYNIIDNVDEIIDQIFNDHEAQLNEVVKAKDEEIIELNHTVSGLNEMYLEAKEEIDRLKAELNSAFIRDLKSIKMSSNGKHATWEMLKAQQ